MAIIDHSKTKEALLKIVEELEKLSIVEREGSKRVSDYLAKGVYDKAYASTKAEEVRKELYSIAGEVEATINDHIETIRATENANAEIFNMNDESMHSAFSIIGTMGEDLSLEARIDIVNSFVGNLKVLKLLKEMYKKYNYSTKLLDEHIVNIDEFCEKMQDKASGVRVEITKTPYKMLALTGLCRKLNNALGLNISDEKLEISTTLNEYLDIQARKEMGIL